MATPALTYALTISFASPFLPEVKEEVKDWLVSQEIESFVEGSVEHCDIPDETGIDKAALFSELGGDQSPLIIYSYDQAWLEVLSQQLLQRFSSRLICALNSMATSTWQEGWKESFRPITTRTFYLYPPWETAACLPGKLPLQINPGMAFGTGQHATTQLCLEALESLVPQNRQGALLDVGTGSGILAIAAQKLGLGPIDACDIDADAMLALKENCRLNGVAGINAWQGSIATELKEKKASYRVIVANILFPVLDTLLPHLARLRASEGVVVLSGILSEQKAAMLTLCHAQGLHLLREFDRDEWACLVVGTEP